MSEVIKRLKIYIYLRDLLVIEDNQKTENNYLEVNNTKLVLLFVLFAIFYFSYILSRDLIHRIGANTDFTDLNAWLWGCARENDGIELYVMTLAMPVYILASYLVMHFSTIHFSFLSKKRISIFYFILLAVFTIINFIFKEQIIFKTLIVFLAAIVLSIILVYLTRFKFNLAARIVLYLMLFVIVTLIGLLGYNTPSVYDYSYYIGPAIKLLDGEKLGTFYIQYNLLGTFLFAAMQKYPLGINDMWFVLIIIFSFWMTLYLKVASLLFKNRNMIVLFLFALIIVRCLSIWGGPVWIPQVSSIRMDLWVPILIVVSYFGFQSIITAIVFSLCYLLDDVFGFLYLALYVAILFYCFFLKLYNDKRIMIRIKDIMLFVLPVISFIIHFIIFGSLGSPAGKIYSNMHFSFLPISIFSSFWLIAWALPICLYFLCQNKQNRILYLFIFGIMCIQLAYFFGRSHEHNLRNISGITIFIFFLTIDTIYSMASRKNIILWATIIFVGGIAANFNSTLVEKVSISIPRIKHGRWLDPNPIDKQIADQGEYLRSIGASKIIVLTDIDSYINYRLGHRQAGYFSPFYANFSTKQTISFLKDEMKNGYRLIIFPFYYYGFSPEDFNKNPVLVMNKERFIAEPLKYNLMEMKIVKY
jgi:hypothetical protein